MFLCTRVSHRRAGSLAEKILSLGFTAHLLVVSSALLSSLSRFAFDKKQYAVSEQRCALICQPAAP
eukprot:5318935-Amphidinium_carterae.1